MRLLYNLRFSVFRDLIGFVTFFALEKILREYQKLIFKTFLTKSELPCKYIIQERIYTPSKIIKLKDVHPH